MYQKPAPKYVSLTEALRKMEHYCAYQERCHQEVEKKLATMILIPEACEKILLHLMQENYLNEGRFAQSFARGKFSIKKWGRVRITQELKCKKISTHAIKIALQELDDQTYLDTFDELAEKKWESLNETRLQTKKKKWIAYLTYRGWERTLIFEKLNELTTSK